MGRDSSGGRRLRAASRGPPMTANTVPDTGMCDTGMSVKPLAFGYSNKQIKLSAAGSAAINT